MERVPEHLGDLELTVNGITVENQKRAVSGRNPQGNERAEGVQVRTRVDDLVVGLEPGEDRSRGFTQFGRIQAIILVLDEENAFEIVR